MKLSCSTSEQIDAMSAIDFDAMSGSKSYQTLLLPNFGKRAFKYAIVQVKLVNLLVVTNKERKAKVR